MKTTLFLIAFIAILSLKLTSQNNISTCGIVNLNDDYFVDLIPDSIVVAAMQNISIFNIDIDGNDINDIQIHSGNFTGPGNSRYYTKLTALNNQLKFALGKIQIDSFPEVIGGELIWTYFFYSNIPEVLDYGEIIDSQKPFSDSVMYLSILNSGFYNYSVDDWLNIGEKYVGVSMQVNDDTLYGWILVEVTNYARVIVKEFACNKNPYIGIAPGATKQAFELYPNPAKNEVYIKLNDENAGKPATFTLCDLSGKKLFRVDEIPQNGHITLPEFAKGLYIAEIVVEGQRLTRKLQIE